MIHKKPHIIGIDVGGSKILLQVFDSKMNLLSEERVKTRVDKGEKGFSDQLKELIRRHFVKEIKVIGIALPGIVNRAKGTLVKAPHLPTRNNFPIKKLMEKEFRVPVFVDHDINAFLMAEMQRPTLKKYKDVVAVMVGTGVGGAVMIDGKLFYGASGYAGEVGHMVINKSAKRKTLEENIGGYYLEKNGQHDALENLGIGLSNLNHIFNPDVFILGGSVYHHILAKDKKKLETMIMTRSLDQKSPKIVDAGKQTSVALGIALLALKK